MGEKPGFLLGPDLMDLEFIFSSYRRYAGESEKRIMVRMFGCVGHIFLVVTELTCQGRKPTKEKGKWHLRAVLLPRSRPSSVGGLCTKVGLVSVE